MNATLENQRKDVNLKEFQEVQRRAAGLFEQPPHDDDSRAAQETLQIAAVHQLRPFLRGEYGVSFRRPAWELLRARLRITQNITSIDEIKRKTAAISVPAGQMSDELSGEVITEYIKDINKLSHDAYDDYLQIDEHISLIEELDQLYLSDLPMHETCFDLLQPPTGAVVAGKKLDGSTFICARFEWARFEQCSLIKARFEGASLMFSHFEGVRANVAHFGGAYLMGARFDGAQLLWAAFVGADLSATVFDGADLTHAQFSHSALRRCSLRHSVCSSAIFDECDMSYCDLERGVAHDASFVGANLFHANLRDSDLSSTNLALGLGGGRATSRFVDADLTDACVEGADLRGVDPHQLKSCHDMTFDRSTRFSHPRKPPFAELSVEEWNEAAEEWARLGARQVNSRAPWPAPSATIS